MNKKQNAVTSSDLPKFETPPVIEVVCGLLFKPLNSLLSAHLGTLWGKFKADYPECREVPPLSPVIEYFDEPRPLTVELSEIPPMVRTWFIHSKQTGIIQVQRDRFHHNWKKAHPEDEYPRYNSVIQLFRNHFSSFEEFLQDEKIGQIEPLQYELTYVNHIPCENDWETLDKIGNVFPDFARISSKDRFLPEPEGINWRTTFQLPEKMGRLHTTIRYVPTRKNESPLIFFELTARGIPKDRSRGEMWKWFDLAHEWIVRGFCDMTAERIRKQLWRQCQ